MKNRDNISAVACSLLRELKVPLGSVPLLYIFTHPTKRILTLLFAIISTINCFSQRVDGIYFEQVSNWKQVKEKAKRENKYIFVDIYTTWCGPCKKMDMETFSDKTVAELHNHNFINVKVNAEKGWGVTFCKEHKVDVYPTYLFFDQKGQKIDAKMGYMDKEKFLTVSKRALSTHKNISELKKYEHIYASKNYDTTFLRKYLTLNEPLSIDRAILLEEYLSKINPASIYSSDVAMLMYGYGKTLTLVNPLAQRTTSAFYKALFLQFQKEPIKTMNMMGTWSMLRNKILEGIEKCPNKLLLDDYIEFNNELENNDYAKLREKYYLTCLNAKTNKLMFGLTLEKYFNSCINSVHASQLRHIDSLGYRLALPYLRKSSVVDTKKVHVSESQRTIMESCRLITFYNSHKDFQTKYLTDLIKQWIPRVVSFYQNNPIYVNPHFVNWINAELLVLEKG